MRAHGIAQRELLLLRYVYLNGAAGYQGKEFTARLLQLLTVCDIAKQRRAGDKQRAFLITRSQR
ncbi:hypothetical protein CRX72_06535 [Pantoea sp. BRM17]|nr:hypothetical protein CRX72_06535 [Pantoea sp. BRM17]